MMIPLLALGLLELGLIIAIIILLVLAFLTLGLNKLGSGTGSGSGGTPPPPLPSWAQKVKELDGVMRRIREADEFSEEDCTTAKRLLQEAQAASGAPTAILNKIKAKLDELCPE